MFFAEVISSTVLLLAVYSRSGQCLLTADQIALFENYNVTFEEDGDDYIIRALGVPHYTPDLTFPTPYNEQNHVLYVPKNPSLAATTTCTGADTIGLALNGVAIFNPLNIDGEDAVSGDCQEAFDSCKGHPGGQELVYHYHQFSPCVGNDDPDEIVGIALDGFLIYGKFDSTGNVPNGLDDCGGKVVDGTYRYYMQTTYPYTLGCYVGTFSSRQDMTPQCLTYVTCNSNSDANNIVNLPQGPGVPPLPADENSASQKNPSMISVLFLMLSGLICI